MHGCFQTRPTEKKALQGNRRQATMTTIDHGYAGSSSGSGNATVIDGADLIALAAAPTFAIFAVLLWSGRLPSPLRGMVPMYLLMGAFHVPHWLKVIASRRSRIRGSNSGARQIKRRTNLPRPEQHRDHE
jgi:hypothetical protein